MNNDTKLKYLSIALYGVGAIFIVGIWTLMQVWSAGWTWEPRQPEYEQMIMGVYATLGVFLILAAKNPMEHLSLIQFTIWSSGRTRCDHVGTGIARQHRERQYDWRHSGIIPRRFRTLGSDACQGFITVVEGPTRDFETDTHGIRCVGGTGRDLGVLCYSGRKNGITNEKWSC